MDSPCSHSRNLAHCVWQIDERSCIKENAKSDFDPLPTCSWQTPRSHPDPVPCPEIALRTATCTACEPPFADTTSLRLRASVAGRYPAADQGRGRGEDALGPDESSTRHISSMSAGTRLGTGRANLLATKGSGPLGSAISMVKTPRVMCTWSM